MEAYNRRFIGYRSELSNEDDKFAVGVRKLDKLIYAENRRILRRYELL